jgi:alkanesulfonate monooxygenase SsuD/methylene tetrahydromethanopterin reductase-like flavin-dependent oxidoreductase (luciferase family)
VPVRSLFDHLRAGDSLETFLDDFPGVPRQQAEAEYGPEVLAAYKYYWKSDSLSFRDSRSEAEFTIDKMAPERIILGSPEEVVDQLQHWQETIGAEMMIFRLRQAHSGGPPHEKILRAIRLFGDKVIPNLA